MTLDLAAILDELEIEAISAHGYRGPMETMAVESMERILRQYGYAHLKMVLMSVVETPHNKRELVGPVLWAISDLVRAHPAWATRASDWFAVFDRVKLGELWALAKLNRRAARPRAAIAALLFIHLHAAFETQGRLF